MIHSVTLTHRTVPIYDFLMYSNETQEEMQKNIIPLKLLPLIGPTTSIFMPWSKQVTEPSHKLMDQIIYSNHISAWQRWQGVKILKNKTFKSTTKYTIFFYACVSFMFGEGNDNPLQNFCLENSMERGAWWATTHGITKSQT